MTARDDAWEQLLSLKLDFIRRLHVGLIDVADSWELLLASPHSAERRDELERKAHSLAGNAGIFGLSMVAAAASELESAVASGEPGADGFAPEMERLASAVARTLAEVGEAGREGPRRQLA